VRSDYLISKLDQIMQRSSYQTVSSGGGGGAAAAHLKL